MQSLLSPLDKFLRGMLVFLMTAMVFSVSWQVVSRYLFSSPSSWTEEVARFLLIWIGTLGAAYAFRTNMGHRRATCTGSRSLSLSFSPGPYSSSAAAASCT